jgi:hypothetical protein
MRLFPPLAAVVVAVCLVWAPSYAAPAVAGDLAFRVLRNGTDVGRHVISRRRSGDLTEVEVKTSIVIHLFFVPIYRYTHDVREVWDGPKLLRHISRRNDNGAQEEMELVRDGDRLRIEHDGKVIDRIGADTLPANLWDRRLIEQRVVLATASGERMSIQAEHLGAERIEVAGQWIIAEHYAVSGDLERELWYDDQERLVKVRFRASDGSQLEYVLE